MLNPSPAALRLGSAVLLLAGWQILSGLLDDPMLPSPIEVTAWGWREATQGPLLAHLAATLRRVALAFLIAMLLGSAIGILMGRSRTADLLLDPWLILLLNIPALVVIVLGYVWFGLLETTAVLAIAINKLPNVIVTLREGARVLDRDYLAMAHSFRIGRRKTLLFVTLPQLLPYFTVAARNGLSLIWKVVLVVELLGRSDGVGFQLHLYFQLFDVAAILAYSMAFILVMLAIEYGILQPLERASNRWRLP
ncbi:MAG: ABC transporter permease [Chromatiaceae bacterium]|nr:ABC transporter permease [Chromatiaceae bacterium]MCP5314198.1 ABC transporter permease [Chromatiaceae bacterium]